MDMSRRAFIASGVAAGIAASFTATAFAQRRGGGRTPQLPPIVPIPGGEDGSKLWLRFVKLDNPAQYQAQVQRVVVDGDSATLKIIRDELTNGITGMMGTGPFAMGVSTLKGRGHRRHAQVLAPLHQKRLNLDAGTSPKSATKATSFAPSPWRAAPLQSSPRKAKSARSTALSPSSVSCKPCNPSPA